ncbi:MAG: GGDEF domain-containing protein [Wenzhouxiangella sp.]|nr:MAG: GGDEF domain-containing protein [Wenzhouxiangella sp.]
MPKFDHGDHQRRQVLLTLIVITFFGGLFFGTLNWIRGITAAALIEFAFALFCLGAFWLVRTSRRLYRWSLAVTIPWILAVWLIVSMPAAAESVFIWALVLPILLMLLLGRRLGLCLSLVSLAGALLIAIYRFGLPQDADQIAYAANLVIAGLVIVALSYVYERSREKAEQGLRHLAVTDALTGLPNRTLLYENFARAKALAIRQKTPLSLMVLDLDRFKEINDKHGHDVGDRVLFQIAELLRSRLRRSDLVFRMGGEEFLVVMPDTDLDRAATLAEDLRQRIAALQMEFHDQPVRLTTSIGVTEMTSAEQSFDSLLRQADQNMYWCKENGRNRVRASRAETSEARD